MYSNATYRFVDAVVIIPAKAFVKPENVNVCVAGSNLQVWPVFDATDMLLTEYVVPAEVVATNLLKFVNVPVNEDGYTAENDVVDNMFKVHPFATKSFPLGSRDVKGVPVIVPVALSATLIIYTLFVEVPEPPDG